MNKNVKTALTIIIVLVVLFLIALPKLSFLHEEEKTSSPENATNSDQGIPVNIQRITSQTLNNTITVTGAVLANESIQLTSEFAGKVSGIYFNEGDKVQKGDLLVRINDEELRAQLEKLKYTLKLYEDTENRMRQLLERDAISQEEYDISLTESKTSAADIKVLEAQINKASIRAPFTGIIGLRYISEGSYVAPSSVIANLYSVEPAKIEFAVPGRYVNAVNEGDEITFTTEGSEEVFSGKVYAIEPKIDPVTRTLQVRALSPNKDRKLFPGQFISITLSLETKEKAIMVPSMAIVPEANGHMVYLVNNGRVDTAKVDIGFRGPQEVEIISGLKEGDSLVVAGIQQVKQGAEVQIMNK